MMDGNSSKLNEIAEFTREMLEKYGLEEWKLVWDTRPYRRYGQCRYKEKEIGITPRLVLINSLEESKNTVLHEIAHALTPGHRHNHVWKEKCLVVGARPEQYYCDKSRGGTVNAAIGKYQLINTTTGKVHRSYYRRPGKKTLERYSRGNYQIIKADEEKRALATITTEAGTESDGIDSRKHVIDISSGTTNNDDTSRKHVIDI